MSKKIPRPDIEERVRNLLEQGRTETSQYWTAHPGTWEQQQEQPCPLCGRTRSGYPFIWWVFPATQATRSQDGIGAIPELVCPDCYGVYRVQTEVWKRMPEEVLLQMLKDRNWRMWLERLDRFGYNDCSPVGGDEKRRAYVVQLYRRGWSFEDDWPSKDFFAIPSYLVATPDALSDPFEFEGVNVASITHGHDFAEIVRGEDELREFLRLGPETWHARRSEGLLTVEQAAERLGVSIKTIYEYCTNFYAYGEYGPMSQPLEGEPDELGRRKRTSRRKLFHYRAHSEIRVPLWAVELFQMQYEKEIRPHPLTTTKNDVRLLLGDQEPYRTWRGREGEKMLSWIPRFEFRTAEGGKRARWSRVLVGILEAPDTRTPWREFSKEYLEAHPCPPGEDWIIEDIKKAGGPVAYDISPDEYWTWRSRMEWQRLQDQQVEAEQDEGFREGL